MSLKGPQTAATPGDERNENPFFHAEGGWFRWEWDDTKSVDLVAVSPTLPFCVLIRHGRPLVPPPPPHALLLSVWRPNWPSIAWKGFARKNPLLGISRDLGSLVRSSAAYSDSNWQSRESSIVIRDKKVDTEFVFKQFTSYGRREEKTSLSSLASFLVCCRDPSSGKMGIFCRYCSALSSIVRRRSTS